LRKILIDLLWCAAMGLSAPAAGAISTVGQAVQRLHLSPQQLLSLRDVLGDVERRAQVEASGEDLFILRDPVSMAYAGEFSLNVGENGTLTVDRVSGPATLDASQSVLLPLRLNPKSRAQARAALAGSQLMGMDPANPHALPPALPEERIAALKFTDAKAAAPIAETRAVFFRDGSGVVRTVRAPQSATAASTPAPLRISDRYFSAVKSDGTHVWRDNVIEIDSDVAMTLTDLQARRACPLNGPCNVHTPAVSLKGFHLIRWQHQLIAAVPPSLLAQLAAAPAPEMTVPAGAAAPAEAPTAGTPATSPAENSDGH
jgi:hypothetical protein